MTEHGFGKDFFYHNNHFNPIAGIFLERGYLYNLLYVIFLFFSELLKYKIKQVAYSRQLYNCPVFEPVLNESPEKIFLYVYPVAICKRRKNLAKIRRQSKPAIPIFTMIHLYILLMVVRFFYRQYEMCSIYLYNHHDNCCKYEISSDRLHGRLRVFP